MGTPDRDVPDPLMDTSTGVGSAHDQSLDDPSTIHSNRYMIRVEAQEDREHDGAIKDISRQTIMQNTGQNAFSEAKGIEEDTLIEADRGGTPVLPQFEENAQEPTSSTHSQRASLRNRLRSPLEQGKVASPLTEVSTGQFAQVKTNPPAIGGLSDSIPPFQGNSTTDRRESAQTMITGRSSDEHIFERPDARQTFRHSQNDERSGEASLSPRSPAEQYANHDRSPTEKIQESQHASQSPRRKVRSVYQRSHDTEETSESGHHIRAASDERPFDDTAEEKEHNTHESRLPPPALRSGNRSVLRVDQPHNQVEIFEKASRSQQHDNIFADDRQPNGPDNSNAEAISLVRRFVNPRTMYERHSRVTRSGAVTPVEEQDFDDYRPPPDNYRGGIAGQLLKLLRPSSYGKLSRTSTISRGHLLSEHEKTSYLDISHSALVTPVQSPPESGATTPISRAFPFRIRESPFRSNEAIDNRALPDLGGLVSLRLEERGEQDYQQRRADSDDVQQLDEQTRRPSLGLRSVSSATLSKFYRMGRSKSEDHIRITVHIADMISRQRYLRKLCIALMKYGAPTHRLEECMVMSARVLETDAHFLYIPDSMIMTFDDADTHTSEVKVVKVARPDTDLGRLRDVHQLYKEVLHDTIGVQEALRLLDAISERGPLRNRYQLVILFGAASACVAPWAFNAGFHDLPVIFALGCFVAFLKHFLVPRSRRFEHVFEVLATIITSFVARALGSISRNGDPTFCFSAVAASSVAMILPGYYVLCASLELQSGSFVAGSVRLVYATIKSLFLGYGILIGTALYGKMDRNATSDLQCSHPIKDSWYFLFVPAFALFMLLINHASFRQAPVMLLIAGAGYAVNYFSSKHFVGNTQVADTFSAFVIGMLANLYSRVGGKVRNWWFDLRDRELTPRYRRFKSLVQRRVFGLDHTSRDMEDGCDAREAEPAGPRRTVYSLAFAAMLPAIYVQVPSGLGIGGSLASGLLSANQITNHDTTNGTSVANATEIATGSGSGLNDAALSVAYSVIQVAIGISMGLFLSSWIVYMLRHRKKRGGLFSL